MMECEDGAKKCAWRSLLDQLCHLSSFVDSRGGPLIQTPVVRKGKFTYLKWTEYRG